MPLFKTNTGTQPTALRFGIAVTFMMYKKELLRNCGGTCHYHRIYHIQPNFGGPFLAK